MKNVSVTVYRCDICGSRYEHKSDAKECEKRGIILPRFKVGDRLKIAIDSSGEISTSTSVTNYKGAVVVKIGVNDDFGNPYHHMKISAPITYLVEFSDEKRVWVSEGNIPGKEETAKSWDAYFQVLYEKYGKDTAAILKRNIKKVSKNTSDFVFPYLTGCLDKPGSMPLDC